MICLYCSSTAAQLAMLSCYQEAALFKGSNLLVTQTVPTAVRTDPVADRLWSARTVIDMNIAEGSQ
jgi:hypothetical protein